MEEKERENEDEDNNDKVINITTTQLFGTPDKAFLIKKNKKTEERQGNDGYRNIDGRGDG